MSFDIPQLNSWFEKEKRVFPWRINSSSYSVWISEVMLQQTRASVVVDYFNRWMAIFPSIASLAEASLDSVIKAWEGLGYYSRARNLHKTAKLLAEKYDGELPSDPELLKTFPGMGPYTVGAICSFAFHQRLAAVDGNVMRVLSRLFCLEEDISRGAVQQLLRKKALELLPAEDSWITSEALIELGATLCNKKPQCSLCPLQSCCLAYKKGVAEQLPYKSGKQKTENLFRIVLILLSEEKVAICRCDSGKVMADLFEFPFLELQQPLLPSTSSLEETIEEKWGMEASFFMALPQQKQTFTKYRAQLYPLVFKCKKKTAIPDFQWTSQSSLENYPFSSGHRRVLQAFKNKIM